MAYANLRATRANESGSFDSQQARARITGEREREREEEGETLETRLVEK